MLWDFELPWLSMTGHVTRATDLARLKKYYTSYPHGLNEVSPYSAARAGYRPLPRAAASQQGKYAAAVITAIARACPATILHRENDGSIALHCAAQHQQGEHGLAVVLALLQAHPRAAREVNERGELPLHIAAEFQRGEHAEAILKVLLHAYPGAARCIGNPRYRALKPFEIAQQHGIPPACVELLKKAAETEGPLRVPDMAPKKLKSAYEDLAASEPDVLESFASVTELSLKQAAVLCRQASVLVETGSSSNSSSAADPLATLAAAACMLAEEDRLPAAAASLLQGAPLLHDMLVAALAPHAPPPVLGRLQELCAAAEDAVARLRRCHAELTSHVSADPPPPAIDSALVDARNAALAAAQVATSEFSNALRKCDMDAVAAVSNAGMDKHTALLHRVAEMTGLDPNLQLDSCSSESRDDDEEEGEEVSEGDARATGGVTPEERTRQLNTAMAQLDTLESDVVAHVARLAALAPVTLPSLGSSDTQPIQHNLEIMRTVTRALLWATHDTSVAHYLVFDAPWQLAGSAVVTRNALLRTEAIAVNRLVSLGGQLSRETTVWAAALDERALKVSTLKATHAALGRARKALLHAKADAEPDHDADSSSDDEGANHAASATALPRSDDALRVAQRACTHASLARDRAAHDLFALALAYYPETLLRQRKRLMPGGLPVVVSQRSREDYGDIQLLERDRDGRHTLLRATFDGKTCVLKMVPMSQGSALVREASILKQVKHRNIVELMAVFVEGTFAYLHMPYASQGDLDVFLRREAGTATTAAATRAALPVLPSHQLQRMARQLCEAVAYLRERSIVHCDIKPANVFVDGNCANDSLRAVLGDFDVSHTATGRTTTLTRAVSGVATHYTPGFAPPEVLFAAEGQPPRVSPAIDMYGLGCVIFAMHMFPRTLPEPTRIDDAVAGDTKLFTAAPLDRVATPAVAEWAATVPRRLVQAATYWTPRGRASARELLCTQYMLEASSAFAQVAIQRPAYWLHQAHTGSWLQEEPAEVRAAVEELLNATAEPLAHGVGRNDSLPFQRFKVTRVQRLEHPAVWASYAAQRRQLADTLARERYGDPSGSRPLATEGGFIYPLEGGSLEAAAGEVFLFHGPSKPASIANSGFDVRYAFAEAGAGATFGRGVYFAESASKADQYVRQDGHGTRPLTMVVARVLLGRTVRLSTTRWNSPFLPQIEERTTADVPVYYDSIVADMREQGLRFREIVVGDGSRAYPELFVEYERV